MPDPVRISEMTTKQLRAAIQSGVFVGSLGAYFFLTALVVGIYVAMH